MFLIISCSEKENHRYQITAIPNDTANIIWFNDKPREIYNFHENHRLYFYKSRDIGTRNGQDIYFYDQGSLETMVNLEDGKKHGIENRFYRSGNLKQVKHYNNDIVRGYFIQYYDKFGLKKAEYMAGLGPENGYVYQRTYDSATQQITNTLDHRHLELRDYPQTNPYVLKMPWE